jgi:hypothetical protein
MGFPVGASNLEDLKQQLMKKTLVLLSALGLAAGAVQAQNLLLNGDFNSPASGSAPDSWQTWAWGGGWANHEYNSGISYDGSYYMVAGGSSSSGGGFYQTLAAVGGVAYELDVLSGADAWWLPKGTMTMFFLDSSGNTLSTATRNTVDPAVYGQNYDIAHPWASYSLTATAPGDTASIKVEFAGNVATGSIWFENASLTMVTVPEPGVAALGVMGLALWMGSRSRRQ